METALEEKPAFKQRTLKTKIGITKQPIRKIQGLAMKVNENLEYKSEKISSSNTMLKRTKNWNNA